MKKLQLHWQILIALFLAVLFGIFFKDHVKYIAWMGEIFLRALKMIIVPLIFTSIVSGITNIGNAKNLGRLGFKTILYYMSTSLLAIITGLFLVNIIKPGIGADLSLKQAVDLEVTSNTISQTLINIIPDNIFSAFSHNTQMLSVIFFAFLFGFFITRINKKPQTLLSDVFNGIFDVMMKITMFVIKFTPLGIFGLVAEKVAEQDDLIALMQSMGLYMGVVLMALSIHAFITLPLIARFIGKINPLKNFQAVKTPLITAFSTSSSSATLPLTLEAVESKAGVSNKISSFTLPLGATINMDGTALYECIAVMFIAQAYGMDMSMGQQIIIVGTALLASIGAAGVPMAGLVMITIILTAVNLPLEGVGLILAVDRILDMFRTATNVWSDTTGAAVIAKSEGETLKI
ncbi:MAG: dicarboxylate/amino acid:cation symporter [Bacteroidales bacterium]|nr:dicarboxylate/amino acid:cation symporter [Bacteroidales bacterium]